MKLKSHILLFILTFFTINLFAGEINLSGVYKGKNLYVQNPFSGNMKSFCVISISVNGKTVKTNPQSSAFEIDLSFLKQGDPVNVKVIHKDDCKPKILNPMVIRTLSDFHFVSTTIDQFNVSWSSRGEATGGIHFVEQYINGKWVNVTQVKGKSVMGICNYKANVKHHAGLNKFRIRYLSKTHKVTHSKEIEFLSDIEPVIFYPKRVTKSITLSRVASYEILDAYGNVIKRGKSKTVDCSSLKSGFYYISIENQTEKFLKK